MSFAWLSSNIDAAVSSLHVPLLFLYIKALETIQKACCDFWPAALTDSPDMFITVYATTPSVCNGIDGSIGLKSLHVTDPFKVDQNEILILLKGVMWT